MGVHIDQIIPWGRTGDEYEQMFAITEKDFVSGVLDCGGGPASFTAEASARGLRATSVDPLYAISGNEIHKRFEAIADSIIDQVRATPKDWIWTYHQSPENLLAARRRALNRFLADYEMGLRAQRYLVGTLPNLPIPTASFGLALCSHLLFLYSDLLDEAFHIQAVRELCRVATETRIFPLLTQAGQPSPHLAAVRSALAADGYVAEVIRVSYELQRGGNEMLRVYRRS